MTTTSATATTATTATKTASRYKLRSIVEQQLKDLLKEYYFNSMDSSDEEQMQQIRQDLVHFLETQNCGVEVQAIGNNECHIINHAFVVAAKNNHQDILIALVEHGVDVNVQNSSGYSALMFACDKGYDPIVRVLLNVGADVNARSSFRSTALHYAAYHGHEEIVHQLLSHGADINAQCEKGNTALMHACMCGHLSLVNLLLDGGADMDLQNCDKDTAINLTKSVAIIELLENYIFTLYVLK